MRVATVLRNVMRKKGSTRQLRSYAQLGCGRMETACSVCKCTGKLCICVLESVVVSVHAYVCLYVHRQDVCMCTSSPMGFGVRDHAYVRGGITLVISGWQLPEALLEKRIPGQALALNLSRHQY